MDKYYSRERDLMDERERERDLMDKYYNRERSYGREREREILWTSITVSVNL